jgi:hypothetical protein
MYRRWRSPEPIRRKNARMAACPAHGICVVDYPGIGYPSGRPKTEKAARVAAMSKRKNSGPPGETRDSKAERVHAAAMAIIETDTKRTRAKTERLRALRLAKEAGTKAPQEKKLSTASADD